MDTTLTDPLVGRVLDGRYRVDARLAAGGMATVYTATDLRLERTVAVKVMHPAYAADPHFVARFAREAKAAARLQHPNVVSVYDQGSDTVPGGAPVVFLVMAYVPGRTLRDLLRERGPLPPARALALLDPVLAALAAAHAAGLIHRDVKPENVLLAPDGRVTVADFGLARAVEASTSANAGTGAGTPGGTSSPTSSMTVLIGTVAYLAPEQVTTGDSDARTDVYAAGVLLYELLTGRPPYDGPNAMAVAFRHVHEAVPAPSSTRPGLPAAVDELVSRATARHPGHRFADARDFLTAVRRLRATLPAESADTTDATDTTVLRLPDATARLASPGHPTLVAPVPAARRPGSHPAQPLPGFQPSPASHPTPPSAASLPPPLSRTVSTPPPSPPAPLPPLPPAAAAGRGRRARLGAVAVVILTLAAVGAGWWLAAGRYVTTPSVLTLSKTAAAQRLETAGLKVQWRPARFDETVPAGRVSFEAPRPGDRIQRGGTVSLALSRGPEVHKLGDLRNASLDRAQQLLGAQRLRSTVTETWSDRVPQGRVISTSPRRGTMLRPRAVVTLTVSKGRQPIRVPDLANRPSDEAKAELTKLGFTVTQTDAFSDTVPAGEVIGTKPAGGATAPHGTGVSITVSKGPELFAIPDVKGMRVAEARSTLESAGFSVRVFAPFGLGTVQAQSPRATTMAERDSVVSIIAY